MKSTINNKLRAQGVVEYALVFIIATVFIYLFVGQIDLKKLKSFAVFGVRKNNAPNVIIIPPMTE